ncbi:MAG: chemotaxis protein CheW, partial [Myxococcales bacterium]|nr:chemotaxis protein CheW [Myxococcales bacterium]
RPMSAREGKYLTFFVGAEEYGVQILKVREIIGMMPVTRVPNAPKIIRGVINLRGKIIPVLDIRRKFGMPAAGTTRDSCIIVVRTRGVEMGAIVDRVSEVLHVSEAAVEDAPDFGAQVDTRYLLGIAKHAERVRLLLDIDEVLSPEELHQMRRSSERAEERVEEPPAELAEGSSEGATRRATG